MKELKESTGVFSVFRTSFVRGQIDDKRDISQKRFVRKFIQKRAVQNPLAPRLRRVAERRLHGSAGGWNGTLMWSGFAEVGINEGDLLGSEEALGLYKGTHFLPYMQIPASSCTKLHEPARNRNDPK